MLCLGRCSLVCLMALAIASELPPLKIAEDIVIIMAKKFKGFGEPPKRQKTKKVGKKSLAQFQQQFQRKFEQGPLGEQFTSVVTGPKGGVKISEVLEAFAQPYLKETRTHEQREILFNLAVMSWNIALMPESKWQPAIDQIVELGSDRKDPRAERDIRSVIEEMIARKLKLFGECRRYIVDFQLQDEGEEFHLSVASTDVSQPDAE